MRILFSILFLFSFLISNGQENQKLGLAVNHIQKNAEKWSLKAEDIKDIFINSEAEANGITYLYLNQAYNNIPIRNAMMTVIIKDGKVVSDAHNFINNVESRINTKTKTIGAEEAILKSASHLGVTVKSKPVLTSRSDVGKLKFDFAELTKSTIPAELKYELVDEKLLLVWNLNLDMKSNADYWDINIDAKSGNFISKHNYTIYCAHHHDAYANHNNCSIKTFRKINDKAQEVTKSLLTGATAAKYVVYKLPAESPNHTAARTVVTDAQYPLVSPFGWHDTDGSDGAEFTITRGNNVYAYQDKNDDDDSDGPETDGGADLNFDFPMDLTLDPRESANAAVTNLFYMVNMMHDVTTTLGFNEEFGNFQQKNYTNKADGDDYVLAQAFDGITSHEAGTDKDANGNPTKINNANFSTPVDGFNGRMQMYLWDNRGGAVSVDEPESIKGFVEYGTAGFGSVIPLISETPVTGKIVLVNDGGNNPLLGCNNLVNGAEIKGNIAMIERGICQFSKKVYKAQQAGAIAAIICNIAGINGGDGESADGMASGTDGANVTIPSVMLKKSDCEKIKVIIAAGGTVRVTFQERTNKSKYLDGALDNGIIAHEFGHGISTRLTGGRLNSSCLSNDEQMGEGWSDFFSLVMTHEEGDKGTDSRGIGTFADAQTIASKGIRRFPYSTDMSINPQTYDDIKGTTGPHPLGEIWASMLWDLYWNFIDKYGYDPDWNKKETGNYKSVFLVMEGMKMQSCNPGFLAGRNAILKADSVHFAGANGKIIWETFARRGLGYYVKAGSPNDRNDGTENFDVLPTLIEKLKITKTADSSVDPGKEITITLNAVNHIPSRQNNVIITDELPAGISYVSGSSSLSEPKVNGNLLTFELGNMEYKQAVSFTYKTKASIDNKSILLQKESFDGDFDWYYQTDVGGEEWFTNFEVFRSPEYSFSVYNVAADTDASLYSIPYTIDGSNPVLRFYHRYNTETGNDGGFLEVSIDGGTFTPVAKEQFIRNGYTGPLNYSTFATPNLYAFSGNSGGDWKNIDNDYPWVDSYVDLKDYKGKSVVFRFRFGSDPLATGSDIAGWFIDDFSIMDIYKYAAQACIISDGGTGSMACTNAIETLVNIDGRVGTQEDDIDYFGIKVVPNPADNVLSIIANSPQSALAKVEILSIEGKTVFTSEMKTEKLAQNTNVNISDLPSGIYMVKMSNGQHVTTKKFVKK
jgi:extracellular elastinolytic metalloproteinase